MISLFSSLPSLSPSLVVSLTRPVLQTSHTYGYRSKLTPHYNKPKSGEIGPVGFWRRGTRHLIDVPKCVIANDEVNVKLKSVREELKNNQVKKVSKKKGANLLFRRCNEGVETDHNKYVTETVKTEIGGEITFRFKAGELAPANDHFFLIFFYFTHNSW